MSPPMSGCPLLCLSLACWVEQPLGVTHSPLCLSLLSPSLPSILSFERKAPEHLYLHSKRCSLCVCVSVCLFVFAGLAGASTLSIKRHAVQNKSRGRVTQGWGRRGGGDPKAERGQRAVTFLLLLSPYVFIRTSTV